MAQIFEPGTQEGERRKRRPKHYADESLESEDGSSSFAPVPPAPPPATKVHRRSDSMNRGSRNDHSYDHSSNETHDGPKLRSQPNIGTEPFQPGDHTSPRTKRRQEVVLNHPKTVESQPVGVSHATRAALAHGSPSFDFKQQGPSFPVHLNNETQLVGPETQAAHAQMETEAAARLKRKRGLSAAPDAGPAEGPPRPNENDDPSSSEGSSERPTGRSNAEASTVAVSRRLVPSPQRKKAPTEPHSSPIPAPKRPRVDNSTVESSSPDPSIDAQALIGRDPIDGGPLQSTCPPPIAARIAPSKQKRPVQQTPSSWDDSSRPTGLPDEGAADQSIAVARAPMEEASRRREEEESGDDEDDGLLDYRPRRSASAQTPALRARTTPKRNPSRRAVSPKKPSPRKNPFFLEGIDDGPSAESSGPKVVEGEESEVDELDSQENPQPMAPSPSRAVAVQEASQQMVDQLLGDTPDEPPVPSRTDLDSSLGRVANGPSTTTEDQESGEPGLGPRPRFADIAGEGSSQEGQTFDFAPTQLETQSQFNPYGTGVHAQLPRLVPDPPSSLVEVPPTTGKPQSGVDTTSLDPSGQKPLPDHLRRRRDPSPALAPPVQSSGSRRTIIPDSVEGSSSARSTVPASSSRAKGKGKGKSRDDPSFVDETILSDDARVIEPSKRLPAIEEVPFVETNYDDPPDVFPRHPVRGSRPGRGEGAEPSSEDDLPLAEAETSRLRTRPSRATVASDDQPVALARRPLPPSRSLTPQPPPPSPVTVNRKTKTTPVQPLKVTKRRGPQVIVPPVPKAKRTRKATAKAQEAATAAAESRKGKDDAKRKEEAVKSNAHVPTSSPLTSVGEEEAEMPVEEQAEEQEEMEEMEEVEEVEEVEEEEDEVSAVPAVPTRPSRGVSSTAEPEGELPLRRILALWTKDGAWYPGKVLSVQSDGAEVEFDDYDRRIVPLACIRRCEFRSGDLVRYVGSEPETQFAPAKGEQRRRSRGPVGNPVSKVVRVYRLVGEKEEKVEVEEGEQQERDDVVVVCDVEADPDAEDTRFSEYQVEALSVPKPAKGQLSGREPSKARREGFETLMAKRMGVGRRTSAVVAVSTSRAFSRSVTSELAPAVVGPQGEGSSIRPVVKKQTVPIGGKTSAVLAGLGFLVTHTGSETEKPKLAAEVRQMGGTVLDMGQVFGRRDTDQDGGPSLELGFRKDGVAGRLDGVFLVSDKPATTLKYLMALALGVPIVSWKWIRACSDERKVVDWIPFAHPAGFSAHLEASAVAFQALSMSRDRHDLDSIERSQPRLRLLDEASIVCVCAKGSDGKGFAEHATSLMSAMGAARIETTTSLETFGLARLSSFDYVVVQKPRAKVAFPRGLAVGDDRPDLVDFDWVKQSLISGKLLEPRSWSSDVKRALQVEAERIRALLALACQD